MILTRDNILRYIREKKAVTPSMIAEDFDTSTMIASAALSELAKDGLIKITYLKLASSPYYYDPKQSSILIELGNKHLKGYDKEIFLKLKEQEVINNSSLSIQEALAIERIKDFAKELNIEHNNKKLKFWVWFQRDLEKTKEQILSVLNSKNKTSKSKEDIDKKNSQVKQSLKKEEINKKNEFKSSKNTNFFESYIKEENAIGNGESKNLNSSLNEIKELDSKSKNHFKPKEIFEDKIENFIENYFRENYLIMESKQKNEKGVEYDVKLIANNITIDFDCFYFKKKPTETDIIKFYASSIKPKLIFIENVPKKLLKLAENLENLTIVNI